MEITDVDLTGLISAEDKAEFEEMLRTRAPKYFWADGATAWGRAVHWYRACAELKVELAWGATLVASDIEPEIRTDDGLAIGLCRVCMRYYPNSELEAYPPEARPCATCGCPFDAHLGDYRVAPLVGCTMSGGDLVQWFVLGVADLIHCRCDGYKSAEDSRDEAAAGVSVRGDQPRPPRARAKYPELVQADESTLRSGR